MLSAEQREELEHYYHVVRPYFQICAGRSVLEIGPFNGIITDLYCNVASSIELVEPNSGALDELLRNFPQATVVWNDIFEYLKTPKEFDVVVCLGVLYHLHSPIQLLEQLANDVKPKYMLLDMSLNEHKVDGPEGCYYNIGLGFEDVNKPGNFYTKPGKPGQRTAKLNLNSVGPGVVTLAMSGLGYRPLCNPLRSPIGFKNNLAFMAFERIN